MMISQPALICLNATWQRLMGKSARDGGASRRSGCRMRSGLAEVIQSAVEAAAESLLVAAVAEAARASHPWRETKGQRLPTRSMSRRRWPRTSDVLAPRRCGPWH